MYNYNDISIKVEELFQEVKNNLSFTFSHFMDTKRSN